MIYIIEESCTREQYVTDEMPSLEVCPTCGMEDRIVSYCHEKDPKEIAETIFYHTFLAEDIFKKAKVEKEKVLEEIKKIYDKIIEGEEENEE